MATLGQGHCAFQGKDFKSSSKTALALLVAELVSQVGTPIWEPGPILIPRFRRTPYKLSILFCPGHTKTY